MSNMSYCRFQNTVRDLRDCRAALRAMLESECALSDDELEAAQALVANCARIVQVVHSYINLNLQRDTSNESVGDVLGSIADGCGERGRAVDQLLQASNDEAREEEERQRSRSGR